MFTVGRKKSSVKLHCYTDHGCRTIIMTINTYRTFSNIFCTIFKKSSQPLFLSRFNFFFSSISLQINLSEFAYVLITVLSFCPTIN